MTTDQYVELLLKGDLPGLAAVIIFLLLTIWKKIKPDLWYRIPKQWQWVLPVLVGFLSGFAGALAGGTGWSASAFKGLVGVLDGFLAMGMHHGLKTSSVPYGDTSDDDDGPPTRPDPPVTILLVLLLVWVSACAAPCQLAMTLSAYEAESLQCVRMAETEPAARACVAEVRARYEPKLRELGESTTDELVQRAREISND